MVHRFVKSGVVESHILLSSDLFLTRQKVKNKVNSLVKHFSLKHPRGTQSEELGERSILSVWTLLEETETPPAGVQKLNHILHWHIFQTMTVSPQHPTITQRKATKNIKCNNIRKKTAWEKKTQSKRAIKLNTQHFKGKTTVQTETSWEMVSKF